MAVVPMFGCPPSVKQTTIGFRNDNRPSPVYVCIVTFDNDLVAVRPTVIVVFDVYMRVLPFDDDFFELSAVV